jgi:hypothetical protein
LETLVIAMKMDTIGKVPSLFRGPDVASSRDKESLNDRTGFSFLWIHFLYRAALQFTIFRFPPVYMPLRPICISAAHVSGHAESPFHPFIFPA